MFNLIQLYSKKFTSHSIFFTLLPWNFMPATVWAQHWQTPCTTSESQWAVGYGGHSPMAVLWQVRFLALKWSSSSPLGKPLFSNLKHSGGWHCETNSRHRRKDTGGTVHQWSTGSISFPFSKNHHPTRQERTTVLEIPPEFIPAGTQSSAWDWTEA